MNKVVKAGIGGLLCLSPAVHAAERLSAFHSDIRIAASGELAVTETIELQSTGRGGPRGPHDLGAAGAATSAALSLRTSSA